MSSDVFPSPFPEHVAFAAVHRGTADAVDIHPDEEALLHPRATEDRRTSFRLGRAAAHRALETLTGAWVPVLRGHHRQPLWPPDIVGAITHTDPWGLACVAYKRDTGGLGIDLERRRDVADIVNEFAGDLERRRLESLPLERRWDVALALFSAKESTYKAFYPRVQDFFGFDAVDLTWQSHAECFVGRFVAPLDVRYPTTREFVVDCAWTEAHVLTSIALPAD